MELRISERKQAKIRIAMQGSAGSGKTYSSLLLAKGLTGGDYSKIAIIDTEHRSADLYAHLGKYNVVSMEAPFSPERYIEAIELCEKAGMDVIILDSISHCWDYLLDVHANMQGNSFIAWSKITPRQNKFVHKILNSSAHIIATMRVKQDYVLSQKNGKMIPEKVGLKAIQRNDLDFEFTIVFDIDQAHKAKVTKDRTGLFVSMPQFLIGPTTGIKIREWCCQNIRERRKEISIEIAKCTSLEALRHVYSKYPLLQKELKPIILEKKKELENMYSQEIPNVNLIEQSKARQNGIDSNQ